MSEVPYWEIAPRPDIRVLPANLEAESALLGAIFLSNLAHGRVVDFLRVEHFSNPLNGRIYAAIGKLLERGDAANPVTLVDLFETDPAFGSRDNAAQYLTQLAHSAITIVNAEGYGRRIHDLYLRRQLVFLANTITETALTQDLDDPALEQIGRAEAALSEIASDAQDRRRDRSMGEVVDEALERAEATMKAGSKLAGLSTGFIDLDERIGGLEAGDVIVLGGRPGQGKTSLAIGIAEHLARRGCAVGLCELDQSSTQLGQRVLAARISVPTQRLRRGDLSMVEWDAAVKAAGDLRSLPLYLDDSARMTVATIRARAREWKRRYSIALLIVDQLQSMGDRSAQDRRREIDSYMTGLKALAKELGIPILILSQLTRASEQRDNRRPQLADLRESGSIEQDADVVLFVHREEYYLLRDEPARRVGEKEEKFNDREEQWKDACEKVRGLAEIIVAKQRQGGLGTVKLTWRGETQEFENYAGLDRLPAQNY